MLGVYFNSWWLPALVFLILLGVSRPVEGGIQRMDRMVR